MKDPIESLAHMDPELEETDVPDERPARRVGGSAPKTRGRPKSIRSHSSFNTMGYGMIHKLNATSRTVPPCPEHLRKPLKPPGHESSCTGIQKR